MKTWCSAFLLAGICVFYTAASEDYAQKLPRLPGQKINVRWGGPAVIALQNGTYSIAAVLPKNTVHYTSFRIDMPGDTAKQALRLTISSNTPSLTRAFYVRFYDQQNRCTASWRTWAAPVKTTPTEVILTAGQSSHGLSWEPEMVKSPGTTFSRIELIIGHKGNAGTVYDAQIGNLAFCDIPKSKPAPTAHLTSAGFEILGIGAKSSELRGSVAFMENGQHYLLTRPQDSGPTGYLILTNLDTGKSEQFFNPAEVRQGDSFGSVFTSQGLYIYDQRSANVVAFDVKTRKFRNLGIPEPRANHFMVYTEAPDGTVYLGGYPRATITAWNPKTGQFRNYGSMDPKESYLNQIATDKNGYVYCGIGSARANLVALDPKTGKVTQILPENLRGLGYGNAISGEDGYAYLTFGKFTAKMLDGKVLATNVPIPPPRKIIAPKYGGREWLFPDRTRVTDVDLYKKVITYQGIDGKKRDIPFDYQSGGLTFTSIGSNGRGRIFGSTCHPMNFVEFNTAAGKIVDHGPHAIVRGGNFCNITYGADGMMYLCEYPGGRLWKFDPARPFDGGGASAPGLPGGVGVETLHRIGKAQNGHFTPVSNSLLLCFGDRENARFTFPVNVKKSGKTYLNILAFEHAVYGTAVFEFQGMTRKANLQNLLDRAKLITIGPLDLQEGTYPFTITVRSHGGTSRPMAGLMGFSVSTDKPAKMPKAIDSRNPMVIGKWSKEVTRPREVQVHPDGNHVVISGYADYGLCGGGFGIHDLKANQNSLISDWLEGHSCIAFRFTENGDIVGGTDIAAPGGGHTIADKPAIFRINWKTRKVTASTLIPNASYVMAVELWNGKFYAAVNDGRILVADPETMKIERTLNSPPLHYGWPVRNGLLKTPDNRLFLLQNKAISEFHPQTGDLIPRCVPSARITNGGEVHNGYLYFASHVQMARYKIPEALK